MAGEVTECGLNLSHPILNFTSCPDQQAFSCLCDASVICCEQDACDRCYSSDEPNELFTFSWPLVAGWYAMLVVLFCFGRRGRFMPRSCFFFRREEMAPSQNEQGELEIDPVVKTRLVVESDLGEEAPACCICLNPLVLGDRIAALECPHLYHDECIVEWLRRKSHCPLCAQTIDVEQQQQPAEPPQQAVSSSSSSRRSLMRLFSSSNNNTHVDHAGQQQPLNAATSRQLTTEPADADALPAITATTQEASTATPATTTTTTTTATRPPTPQHAEQELRSFYVRRD